MQLCIQECQSGTVVNDHIHFELTVGTPPEQCQPKSEAQYVSFLLSPPPPAQFRVVPFLPKGCALLDALDLIPYAHNQPSCLHTPKLTFSRALDARANDTSLPPPSSAPSSLRKSDRIGRTDSLYLTVCLTVWSKDDTVLNFSRASLAQVHLA